MAYTTLQLINNAYYASGVVSREFETVSGEQAQDGLQWLNELLADKTVDNALIPYYQAYDFNAVTGQEAYFIQDLIEIDTFTFYIDSVRYSTSQKSRRHYFGESRADNIQSLPGTWHFERTYNGATLYIYFLPDQNYPLQIWGQFRLSSVTINQDLSLTLDQFYINFLRYELAERICAEFDFTVPPGVEKNLKRYRHLIAKKSGPIDLRMLKVSSLQKRGAINYGQVNLGKGWTT